MRRILVLLVSVALLSVTTLAHAISPAAVRAVAERPVTLHLEKGGKIEGEVLSQQAGTFIVSDTAGMIHELSYDDVKSIRVRSVSAVEEAPVSMRERALARTAEREADERAREERIRTRAEEERVRREDERTRRENERSRRDEDRIQDELDRRHHETITNDSAELEAARDAVQRRAAEQQAQKRRARARDEANYPRIFVRAAVDLGYGRLHENSGSRENNAWNIEQMRGVAFGGDLALGARISEKFAFHTTLGVRRAFLPSDRTIAPDESKSDRAKFEKYNNRVRMMNIGLGFSFLTDQLVLSASFGAGQARDVALYGEKVEDQWGFGGDVMVGVAKRLPRYGRVGLAVAVTWIATLRKDDDPYRRFAGYTVGPRVFYAY